MGNISLGTAFGSLQRVVPTAAGVVSPCSVPTPGGPWAAVSIGPVSLSPVDGKSLVGQGQVGATGTQLWPGLGDQRAESYVAFGTSGAPRYATRPPVCSALGKVPSPGSCVLPRHFWAECPVSRAPGSLQLL